MRTIIVVITVWASAMAQVWAHPGPLDACGGHGVQEYVEYPDHPSGEPTYPSEPGEYHLHFTPRQMNEEALPSLSEYRRTHPTETSLGIDHGSFVVGGRAYDILEYTRTHREAIIHCRGEDITKTGIARIRLEE